jgi:hypothetical protein
MKERPKMISGLSIVVVALILAASLAACTTSPPPQHDTSALSGSSVPPLTEVKTPATCPDDEEVRRSCSPFRGSDALVRKSVPQPVLAELIGRSNQARVSLSEIGCTFGRVRGQRRRPCGRAGDGSSVLLRRGNKQSPSCKAGAPFGAAGEPFGVGGVSVMGRGLPMASPTRCCWSMTT